MNHSKLICLVLSACLLAAGPAQGALNAYMKLTGQRQGRIQGGVTQRGKEGSIEVIAFSHEIISPRDPATGLPTGRRQHKPFTVKVTLDRALPLLYQALATSETFTDLVLQFYRPSPDRSEVNHFTIALKNASIASIKTVLPDTQDANTSGQPEQVEISFTYQKIIWTWSDGGISAEDDWAAPVG